MKLDDITALLGNFGRYQFLLVSYIAVRSIFGCFSTLGNVFFAAETDHWCSMNRNCSSWAEFEDNCTQVKRSILIPPQEDLNRRDDYPYSNCLQWELPEGYVFDPYTPLDRFNYSKVPCSDWEYDTTQYKTTTVMEFNLVCSQGTLPSIAQSIYFGGALVGAFVGGSLSDWIGRKKTVILMQLVWISCLIVTTFSVHIYMYMAIRFLVGFGAQGAYLSLFTLALEVVGKSHRTGTTMALGITYAIGYFFLATAAMYIREWRSLSLVFSVGSVLLIIPMPFIQESARWLVSRGRIEEAERVIRKIAKINKKTLPDTLFDKEDIQEQTESRESAIPPSVIDLYRTPNMAVKSLNMQYNWFVNSLVYYGLSQSTGDLGVDDYWAFFVSGAVEIPALLYAAYSVERFGRKWNTSILEIIGGVACLATIFMDDGIPRTAVSMIGKFCISATFSIIYLYSTEILPTPVRAVGLGVCSVADRVGGILSPIILLLKKRAKSLPLILFGSSAVIAGLLALFLPETKGQKLPQTLREGEQIGKCRCMGGDEYDQSATQPYEMDTYNGDAFSISNAASDNSQEKKESRDFSQNFTKTCRESAHM